MTWHTEDATDPKATREQADNPCLACGACCQYFRVSFYHGELDTQPGGTVPADLTTPISPFRVCMQGTEQGLGRCVALRSDGRCEIYAQRPSVCREFPAVLPNGQRNPECARIQALVRAQSSAVRPVK